ncbi:MAG: hypothetical protein WC805_00520 [Patescibacteria group bacterium]
MCDQTTNPPTEGEETKCTCSETCPDDCSCEKCGCGKEAAETETPTETEETEEKPAEGGEEPAAE